MTSDDKNIRKARGSLQRLGDAQASSRGNLVMPYWFYFIHALTVGLPMIAFSFGPVGMTLGAATLAVSQALVVIWRRRAMGVEVGPSNARRATNLTGAYYLAIAVLFLGGFCVQELLPVPHFMILAGTLAFFVSLYLLPRIDRSIAEDTKHHG